MNNESPTFDDLPEEVRRALARRFDTYGGIVGYRKSLKERYDSILDTLDCMRSDLQAHIAELNADVGQYDTEMSCYIGLLEEAVSSFKDPAHIEVLNRYIEKLKVRRESIIDKWLDIKSSLKKENGA